MSFFGVVLVVARWKRPTRKQTAPPETLSGATAAAIRYVRNSPAILTLLLRTGIVLFFSSSLFALLPSVARSVDKRAIGYGLLLGCFGTGAIGGALIMQALRAHLSTEIIVSAGVVVLGIVIVTMPRLHSLLVLAPAILASGAAWVLFISLINALVQNLAPDWVRARVLAIFTLVYMGSFALGSAAWGGIAQRRASLSHLSTPDSEFLRACYLRFSPDFRIPQLISLLGITGGCRSLSKRSAMNFLVARCWSRSNTLSWQSWNQSS